MAEQPTAIVGIGTEYFRCLSQVHVAEDLLGERYPLVLRPRTMPVQLRDVDGTVHNYELRVGELGTQRRAERLERLLGPDEYPVALSRRTALRHVRGARDRGVERRGPARRDDLRRHANPLPPIASSLRASSLQSSPSRSRRLGSPGLPSKRLMDNAVPTPYAFTRMSGDSYCTPAWRLRSSSVVQP